MVMGKVKITQSNIGNCTAMFMVMQVERETKNLVDSNG